MPVVSENTCNSLEHNRHNYYIKLLLGFLSRCMFDATDISTSRKNNIIFL